MKTNRFTQFSKILFLLCFSVAPLSAEQFELFTYRVDGEEVTITDYPTTEVGAVEIPAEIDGKPVTRIYYSAFNDCRGLTSVTISESVTRIDYDAFSGCSVLTSILVASENPSYASEAGVLFNAPKTKLIKFPESKVGAYTIPEGVTKIDYGAFDGCGSLTSVTIPDTVTFVGVESAFGPLEFGGFFECSSLTSIHVASGNPSYASEDGVLFDASKTRLIKFPGGKAGAYVIPENVTTIGYGAFDGCGRLTSVTIHNEITIIESGIFSDMDKNVFEGCSNLTSILVASGNNAYASKDGVLFNASKTWLIKFPEGKAGDYSVPKGVTNIFDHAFYGCSGLTSISIPGTVRKIHESTFSSCSRLTNAIFLGHAPCVYFYCSDSGFCSTGCFPAERPVFTEVAPDFTIHRFRSSTGFSSPGWQDYPTVMIDEAPYLGISWLLAHDLPYDTDLHQDLNGDGVSLLMAYALDLDPNLYLQNSLPKPLLGDGTLGISFYGVAEGITYTVETSRDLKTWTTEGVVMTAPDEAGQRMATISRDSQKGFLRLVVAE